VGGKEERECKKKCGRKSADSLVRTYVARRIYPPSSGKTATLIRLTVVTYNITLVGLLWRLSNRTFDDNGNNKTNVLHKRND